MLQGRTKSCVAGCATEHGTWSHEERDAALLHCPLLLVGSAFAFMSIASLYCVESCVVVSVICEEQGSSCHEVQDFTPVWETEPDL